MSNSVNLSSPMPLSNLSSVMDTSSDTATAQKFSGAESLFENLMKQTAKKATSKEGALENDSQKDDADPRLQQTFQDFVGQTLFSQLIASMRTTQQEPAYFHGGQAEKIFQGQLDQVLSEEISKASAKSFSEPMFRLFQLQRR